MLLISTVHAETFPRYLDTVHSLSRSASFHATSLFPFADNSSQGLCGNSGGYIQQHITLSIRTFVDKPQSATTRGSSGRNLRKTAETSVPMRGRSETVPRPFRDRSEHDPRPFASVRNPPRNRGCFSRSGRTVCIEKYNISRSGYLSKFHQVLRLPLKVPLELHQVLRLPRKVTLELHQVLRLPRKVTLDLHQVLRLPRKVTLDLHQVLRLPHRMTRRLDPRHIWNVISNARRNKCHPPNSPNTAPATQNDHPTSAEICGKQLKRHFQCAADPRPFRDRSEHDPRPFASVRNPPRNRGYFSRSGRTVCIEKYNISRSGYLSKCHQVLRLPRKVTLELHQVLRLPRKLTLELHQVLRLPRKVTLDLHQVLRLPHRMTRRLDPRHIWNVISNARRNKCHPPNSPNTAPATQNDHPTSGRNLRKTAETSFPMRGRSETVPSMIRDRLRQSATRHATEVAFRAPDERFVLKNTTFRAPAIFPNFTKSCAYH